MPTRRPSPTACRRLPLPPVSPPLAPADSPAPPEEADPAAYEDPATVAPGVLAKAPPPYSAGFDAGAPYAPHYYPEGYAPQYRPAHAHGYPYAPYPPYGPPPHDLHRARPPVPMARGGPGTRSLPARLAAKHNEEDTPHPQAR